MNKWIYTIGFCTISFFGIAVGGIAYSQSEARNILDQIQFHPTALKKVADAYTHLATIDAFFPIGSDKDAGDVLNQYIKLDGSPVPAETQTGWNNLSKDDLNLIKENWHTKPETLPTVDDSILLELLVYDHWDTGSSGAYESYLSKEPDVPIFEAHIPHLGDIQHLAKLRLARGLREGNILPALKEVRHLARLCQGTESLISTMIGIALLSIERQAYEAAIGREILSAEDWIPISKEDCELARKLGFAGVGIYIAQDDGASLEKVQALDIRLFSHCSTLSEAGSYFLISSIPSGHWFGEAQLFTPRPRFEKAWEESHCTLPSLKRYWNSSMRTSPDLTDSEVALFSVPYLRTLILAPLLQMATYVPSVQETDPF